MKNLFLEDIFYLEQVDSTNSFILRSEEFLMRDGFVVVAHKQTSGRGQKGRKWESGDGENLFLSFVLHFQDENKYVLGLLPPLLGLSVLNTILGISQINIDIRLKWPNDVLVKGKKISGILCESIKVEIDSNDIMAVVCGIGVNICGTQENFSYKIRKNLETLENITGKKINKYEFIKSLIENVNYIIDSILKKDISHLILKWNSYCYCKDKIITILSEGSEITGEVKGISKKGELIIKTAKEIRFINSGTWVSYC